EARTVALRRQLPVGRKELFVAGLVDPVVVRPRHDLDRPDLVGGEARPALRLRLAPRRTFALGHRHDLALLQRSALHAADAGLVEGRARAQPGRRIDAAGDGDVAADAHLG